MSSYKTILTSVPLLRYINLFSDILSIFSEIAPNLKQIILLSVPIMQNCLNHFPSLFNFCLVSNLL